jgi:hypothetical protein
MRVPMTWQWFYSHLVPVLVSAAMALRGQSGSGAGG